MDGTILHDVQQFEGNGAGRLFVIVLLAIPSLFAFLAAIHSSQYPASGLWFFYAVSRNVGYLGIAIATGLTWVAFRHRSVSATVGALMVSSTMAAIILSWYAGQVFGRAVAFIDDQGKQLLQEIYRKTNASFVADSPLTHYFAHEAMQQKSYREKHGG